jgi:hypothetical protein
MLRKHDAIQGILLYIALVAAFAVPGALAAVLIKDHPQTEIRYAVCGVGYETEYVSKDAVDAILQDHGLHLGPCRQDEPSTRITEVE